MGRKAEVIRGQKKDRGQVRHPEAQATRRATAKMQGWGHGKIVEQGLWDVTW